MMKGNLVAVGKAEQSQRMAAAESLDPSVRDLPAAFENEGAEGREPRQAPQPGVRDELAVGEVEARERGKLRREGAEA